MMINASVACLRYRSALVRAAILLTIVSGAWDWSSPASAQIGSVVITVSAPASGSTVKGLITVEASVQIAGMLIVQGVQFTLDGANLGAEDTSAPYSIPWNTKTTGNGFHTLRAIGRGPLGTQWMSAPVTVTVFNDRTPPAVSITAPVQDATVSGTATVSADASDNIGVVGVQFRLDNANLGAEDTTAPFSVLWNTAAVSDGPHMLSAIARDGAGNAATSTSVRVTVANAGPVTFAPGDVFVSLEPGPVQWWLADGTPRAVLTSTVTGLGEGLAFDRSGNLYVARWRSDAMGVTGNTVEKFNSLGQSMGAVGTGYNCDPHTIAFTNADIAYVGQAGCQKSILKFVPGQTNPIEMFPAEEGQGIFWMDLAPDECTMFYTSVGPNVKRFDVCNNVQLTNFNIAALPGAFTHDLRVLPDGGVLVANGEVITRLNAVGLVVRTYQGPPESTLWAGLDLVGDGTFWAANYFSSTIYRFDLATGTIVDSFNTGTPPNTTVAVRVVR
jgi:hypothetical protein